MGSRHIKPPPLQSCWVILLLVLSSLFTSVCHVKALAMKGAQQSPVMVDTVHTSTGRGGGAATVLADAVHANAQVSDHPPGEFEIELEEDGDMQGEIAPNNETHSSYDTKPKAELGDALIPNIEINDTEQDMAVAGLNFTFDDDNEEENLNLRPIIGILSQEPGRLMRKALKSNGLNYTSYIAASYVKSVEGAGARVVPILINQPEEYYRKLVSSLNGILFPGGSAKITDESGYGRAGDLLYQLVMSANRNGSMTPLWATCLGFEMLVYLAADRQNPLSKCRAQNRADPLHLQPGWESSQLWKNASPDLMSDVQKKNITSNFHKFCVTPETFSQLNVSKSYKLLSTNLDDNNIEYVSTIEHNQYPIFGTQWHPEKAPYEWKKISIPHTPAAVRLERHVSERFVDQARRNHNSFSSEAEAEQYLIYNYSPIYIAKLYSSSFQQCYFF